MTVRSKKVLDEVLSLPPIERAEIVDRLLASLQSAPSGEIDQAWAAEAEDRIDAYAQGQIDSIPTGHVFKEIKQSRPSAMKSVPSASS